MTTGVRSHFERQLAQLNENVLALGGAAHQAVAKAYQALIDRNPELAREVIAGDKGINDMRYELEKQCYALIATEQPVAGDLRAIIAALTVSTDLERIGDHGKKVARTCLRMLEDPRSIPMNNLDRLCEQSLAMLDRALRAYASRDVEEAEAMCRFDQQVDGLYKQTFNVLLTYMLEDARLIGTATQLLQVAHELERVGDRATNIGERVIYSVTGELIEING